ncbi:hypothetical protein KCU88_g5615, partial [Aureobasidium melanogenum]
MPSLQQNSQSLVQPSPTSTIPQYHALLNEYKTLRKQYEESQRDLKIMSAAMAMSHTKLNPLETQAKELIAFDLDITTSQVNQKFYKLKKESEKLLGENDTSTAPKTPKTSARKTNPSSTGTKRKRRAPEEAETPTKLAKKEETASKSGVKQELDDDVKVKPEYVSDNEHPSDE